MPVGGVYDLKMHGVRGNRSKTNFVREGDQLWLPWADGIERQPVVVRRRSWDSGSDDARIAAKPPFVKGALFADAAEPAGDSHGQPAAMRGVEKKLLRAPRHRVQAEHS